MLLRSFKTKNREVKPRLTKEYLQSLFAGPLEELIDPDDCIEPISFSSDVYLARLKKYAKECEEAEVY